jgi:hypothetical protein
VSDDTRAENLKKEEEKNNLKKSLRGAILQRLFLMQPVKFIHCEKDKK